MRKFLVVPLALALALAIMPLKGSALAAPSLQTTELTAQLVGGPEEVPNPGDPDGTGTATVTLDMGSGQISYTINASNITLPAAAAHIHEGERGVAGPVVVPLDAPGADGMVSGTTAVDAALMQRIQQNPGGFYVNVHTSDYPSGAIRGQLAMGAPAGDANTGGTAGDASTGGASGGAAPTSLPNTAGTTSTPLALIAVALVALGAGAGLLASLRRRNESDRT